MTRSDLEARERIVYESITDKDLATPVGELSPGKSQVIEHVLRGPYAENLLERIDAIIDPGDTE
jgi:hypothetical protein